MRPIKQIVIHCSATPEGRDVRAKDIRKWHIEKGWSDIGYHYVINLDGTMDKGRDISQQGAHVRGHNKHSIGICYIGGVDEDMKAKDTRTDCQKEQLIAILKQLKSGYPEAEILGHRDFDGVAKDCPSFDVKTEYKNL